MTFKLELFKMVLPSDPHSVMFMFKFGVYWQPPFLCLLQQLNEVTKKILMTCGFVRFR